MARLRAPDTRPVIAVTGGAGGLGVELLRRLASRDDLGGLVGIDTGIDSRTDSGAPPVDGVDWRTVDVRDPVLRVRLAGVTTLVHLATTYDVTMPADARRTLNVRGTELVLQAAHAARLARVVLVTSAEVHGALPDNPVPLPDSAPLRSRPDPGTLSFDHLEVERLAEASRVPVTVLRPATLVGGSPAYDGQLLRQLGATRLLAVRGHEPQWQLCHVEDLLAALELAATGVVSGHLGVGCDGALPQARVELLTGQRRLELPAAVALSTAERLHRLGVTTASPRELDHLLGPLVVGCDGLRAAGWVPSWTNERALVAHLAARDGSRTGAYTAAGATVALLGTAALVRRARRRRR